MSTCLKNNGVEYPMQSKEIMKKSKKTFLEKYGKDHYTQTDMYKDNVHKSNMNTYGSEWYMSSKDFKNKSKKQISKDMVWNIVCKMKQFI